MKKLILFASVAALFLASGCATISNGTTQGVNLKASNNKNVTATIDGRQVLLPGKVEVPRKGATIVVSSALNPCYEDTQTEIKANNIQGWFWGNIVTGGTLGSLTDYGTGGMWKYDDADYIVIVKEKPNCK